MPKTYLIGIDLGTSSTKAALYTEDGVLVADSTLEVPIYYPKPGVVEQENDDFYQTAAKTVRTCITESGIDPGQVAAIACDSQMAGIGTVDEHFNPATRFDSWLDMRCEPYIDFMDKNYGDQELWGFGYTIDRMSSYLRPWHENLMVEGRTTTRLPEDCKIYHSSRLCGWQNGGFAGRRCLY